MIFDERDGKPRAAFESPVATTASFTTEAEPLVSCLCITRGKPQKLRRAIRCFAAQRHPHRELIVVYEDDDPATESVVFESSSRLGDCIKPVRVGAHPKLTLGELRNIAVEAARGEYICQWDDDDWYHNERIVRQLLAIRNSARNACLLTNWLVFDELERKAYFSQFRLWEGSLFCRRDIVTPEVRYPSAIKHEDTVFTGLLVSRGHVFPLVDPSLYIYTVHKTNTWQREHFERIFSRSQLLGPAVSQQIEEILDEKHEIAVASTMLLDRRLLEQLNYFPRVSTQLLSST